MRWFYGWECHIFRKVLHANTMRNYLKGIKFRGYKSSQFLYHFREILFPRKVSKKKNLNTCQVWDYLSLNIWSKYDIDTCVLYMSTYINGIRVFVIYLITNTLIDNRKIDIQWDFRVFQNFYWDREIKLSSNVLQSPNREIKYR